MSRLDEMDRLREKLAGNKPKHKVSLLPHNQELYDGIVAKIAAGSHSIFFSEATGLGKSYVFMRLVEDYFINKKVLYIVPKIAIWENIMMYPEFEDVCSHVKMATMTMFNKQESALEFADEYDVVFVDEAHHLASDIQGTNVKVCMDKIVARGGYIFGMTATPLVRGVFIDEVYFDEAVYGNNLTDAIAKGLFPKIRYEIGLPDTVAFPEDVKVKYNVESTSLLLDSIIEENRDINHWLAFFGTTEELEENEVHLRKLFPDFEIFKVYSGLYDNSETLSKFNKYEGKSILMSVSMLLEGVHLKYCEGVLLYRNVTVNNTMLQIIGRLCKANNGKSPLFIDITSSITGLRSLFSSKISSKNVYNHVKVDTSNFEEFKRVVVCSQKMALKFDLIQKLEDMVIHEYRGVRWTSLYSLSVALGVTNHAVYGWLQRHPGKCCEDYIDYRLGDGECSAGGRRILNEYRGVQWNSIKELVRNFGYNDSDFYDFKRKHPNGTEEDYIDFNLDERKGQYDRNSGCSRGLCYRSIRQFSIKLIGKPDTLIQRSIRLSKPVEEIAMCYWERYKSQGYKGVSFSNLYELADHFSVTVDYINDWLDENKASIQNFIDAHTGPKQNIVTESKLLESKEE